MGKARATVTYMSNLNVGADQKHHDARTEVPVAPRGREREKEPEVLTSDLSLHSWDAVERSAKIQGGFNIAPHHAQLYVILLKNHYTLSSFSLRIPGVTVAHRERTITQQNSDS